MALGVARGGGIGVLFGNNSMHCFPARDQFLFSAIDCLTGVTGGIVKKAMYSIIGVML